MSKMWADNYHKKGWYKKLIDEFFESGFLQELGIPVSEYIKVAEYCDQQAKEKKEEKQTLAESIRYFKRLKKSDPIKYDKVCKMMGWDLDVSYMEANKKMGSLYDDMVYMDTDSVKGE